MEQERWRLVRLRGSYRAAHPGVDVDPQTGLRLWTHVDWQIWQVTKRLRWLTKKYWQKKCAQLEEELFLCHKTRRMARAHAICHTLAGRSMGAKKPQYNHLQKYVVSRDEWRAHLALPGNQGGAAARFVELSQVESDYREEQKDYKLKDVEMNLINLAKNDFNDITHALKSSTKRKGFPFWSLPTELWIICMCPNYTSVISERYEGLGQTKAKDIEAPLIVRRFKRFLVHIRQADMTPVDAHRCIAAPIDKRNGKIKIPGSRIIYNFCPFWGAFYRAGLSRGEKFHSVNWPSYDHGFLVGRRREGAMLTQRVMSERMRFLRMQCIDSSHDLANAFGSTPRRI